MVWQSILKRMNEPGFENEYVTVADIKRSSLAKHPWSLGGGGASQLKELLDNSAAYTLEELGADIGLSVITGENSCFLIDEGTARRRQICHVMPIGDGVGIRDWSSSRKQRNSMVELARAIRPAP
jgi:hypothetical protein